MGAKRGQTHFLERNGPPPELRSDGVHTPSPNPTLRNTMTVAPQYHATNGILTFVGKRGITGIAQ
jgi:hypothetical protein